MKITINGIQFEANNGATILDVARANTIPIIALCSHAALESWGACRLCVVEITRKEWGKKTKIVSSCTYPAEDGLIVETDTAAIRETRKVILDLLLARAPGSKMIQQLARAHGLKTTTYLSGKGSDNCILCNTCVRVCEKLGAHAISTVKRGSEKEIGTPFGEPPPDCIGCGSCSRSCPTENIPMKDSSTTREIHGKLFTFAKCDCGAYTGLTVEQVAFLAHETNVPEDYFKKCDACKRKTTAGTFAQVVVNPAMDLLKAWGFTVEDVKKDIKTAGLPFQGQMDIKDKK